TKFFEDIGVHINNKDYSKSVVEDENTLEKDVLDDSVISTYSKSESESILGKERYYYNENRIKKLQQYIQEKGLNVDVTGQLDRATFQALQMIGINDLMENGVIQEDSYRGDGLNLYAYVQNNPINYIDPSGHCKEKNYGNGFITISGKKIPIYIPEYSDGLNANFNNDGWNNNLTKTITDLELNWVNAIGHFGDTIEEDKGIPYKEVGNKQIMDYGNFTGGGKVQGTLFALEIVNTAIKNTTRNVLSITVQEKNEQKRAIIQAGSYNNTLMKKAGKTYNKLAFGYWAEPGHNTAVKGLNDYLTSCGYGEYVEGEKHTNVRLTVDSNHANDPFVGYIGVNDDDQLTMTPKLYKDDNAQIISEKTILYQYYTGKYDVKYDMYNNLRESGTGVIKNSKIVKDASKQFEFSNK
ncbi:MAG: hypothetical protein N4A55_09395, partial [Vallitalea sp.]|nr:hypothetical protein [Vallitalea sp.]